MSKKVSSPRMKRSVRKNEDDLSKAKLLFPWANLDNKTSDENIDDLIIKSDEETESMFNVRKALTLIIFENEKINLNPKNCISVAFCIVKKSFGYKYSPEIELLIEDILHKIA